MRVCSILLCVMAALTAPVEHLSAAQTDGLETVVVTVSRLDLSAEALPGDVTVLDRESIEARGKANTLDLLREVAGVHVSQTGGLGSVSSLFVQGGEPNFTTIMIDGVKVNDPTNSRGGSYDFATLNVDEIERVEILRGPQSVRYGSNGLSGIINIVTRGGADAGSLLAEVGSDELVRAGINLGHTFASGQEVTLTATSMRDEDSVPGDEFENSSVAMKFSGGDEFYYELSGRYNEADAQAFPEDSGGPDLAVLRDTDEREYELLTASARFDYRPGDAWGVTWHSAYLDQDASAISPGIAPGILSPVPPNGSDSDYERFWSSAYVMGRISEQWRVVAGVDWQREEGDQTGYLEFAPGFRLPTDFELERDTLGGFVEFEFVPADALTITGSLRVDDPDTRDSETTVNVGVQYAFGEGRVFATWGEAFKLPSFFALGHGLVGNPDLEPETSKGWSVGAGYAPNEGMDFTASAFRTRYEDLIDFDFELFTNVNRSTVTAQGAEASARLAVAARGTLNVHVSYLDLDAPGTTLRQRPQWRGGMALDYAFSDRLRTRVAWLHVGESFDSSIPTGGVWLDDYDRLDVRVSWDVSEALEMWAAFDNAANASYQEVVGFPAPRARSRFGLRYSF